MSWAITNEANHLKRLKREREAIKRAVDKLGSGLDETHRKEAVVVGRMILHIHTQRPDTPTGFYEFLVQFMSHAAYLSLPRAARCLRAARIVTGDAAGPPGLVPLD